MLPDWCSPHACCAVPAVQREAGTTVRTASYLPAESQVFCRFLSSRKVALVDAGERCAVLRWVHASRLLAAGQAGQGWQAGRQAGGPRAAFL